MRAYRLAADSEAKFDLTPAYFATRQEAHDHSKTQGTWLWDSLFIDLIELPSDQKTFCSILNGEHNSGALKVKVLRSWSLTPRGGLKECTELGK